ncbi:MAG: hypothetical protein KDG54_19065, partial [Geminicoccaceae bacterium]|nr:hypothetical protein [Geminicoccaceae bacterium]
MLAKRRGFYRDGKEVIRTPLLLPSFSSKGFPEAQNILQATQEVIDGEILVSAYDLHHKKLTGSFDFAEAIFLDSGGYEAGKDVELSDIQSREHVPAAWTLDDYNATVAGWQSSRPTVIVSYNHPCERIPVPEQIARADQTIPLKANIFREILFKPSTADEPETDVNAIVKNIHALAKFDAIGVTEKEIGGTQQARMVSIARIRRALNDAGLGNKPIHVFGSLDTISTPLYFVAGADIFDGLTWLRFAYYEGLTIYRQNFGNRCKSPGDQTLAAVTSWASGGISVVYGTASRWP